MNDLLMDLRSDARALARGAVQPSFYLDYAEDVAFASDLFFNQKDIIGLQQEAVAFLYDDYMFGIEHSKKLAQDACALLMAWDCGVDAFRKRRLSMLAQVIGLMSDIESSGGDDEGSGGGSSLALLDNSSLFEDEKQLVAMVLARIEIGGEPEIAADREADILVKILHDAELFRLGGDIFSTVMWRFCEYGAQSLSALVPQFEKGVQLAGQSTDAFRSAPGRKYGPEIVALGADIGQQMLVKLREAAAKAPA